VVFGHQSTGAADDLEKLSELARSLVCRFGMTAELGPISYDTSGTNPFLGREMTHSDHMSDETAAAIDTQVRKIVDQCHQEAVEILKANRELMDKLAVVLIEKESLDRVEFEEAVQKHATMKPPPLKVPLKSRDEDSPEVPDRKTSINEDPDARPESPGEKLPPPEPLGA
jgi:cell division protease FtsH